MTEVGSENVKGKSRFPRVAGNDVSDVHAVRKERYSVGPPVGVVVHAKIGHDHRSALAKQFAERWAMVAGEPDGEDAAGRQKLRRMTPAEIAAHACETVDALEKEFEARGWSFAQPSYDEMIDAVKEIENGND